MHIISASRRTDIPHYFSEWFGERRKAGFAEYRTIYGGGKDGKFRVSMKNEDILGYLFWRKYAGPFYGQLARLKSDGIPYVSSPSTSTPKVADELFVSHAPFRR